MINLRSFSCGKIPHVSDLRLITRGTNPAFNRGNHKRERFLRNSWSQGQPESVRLSSQQKEYRYQVPLMLHLVFTTSFVVFVLCWLNRLENDIQGRIINGLWQITFVHDMYRLLQGRFLENHPGVLLSTVHTWKRFAMMWSIIIPCLGYSSQSYSYKRNYTNKNRALLW